MSMYPKIKMPIGQTRLVYTIIMAVPIAVFMYMATVNLHWFTINRVGYLVYGVMAGLLLGVVESRIVLARLSKATAEVTVWETHLLGLALFGIPFLLVLMVFGSSEYAPFGLFAFFPMIISLFAVSGWFYNKYEKANSVHLFVFTYGFRYWIEPNPGDYDRFSYFLQDVASKDTSLLWSNVGYPGRFLRELSKNPNIEDAQTRDALQQLLKLMSKIQIVMLTHFGITMIFSAGVMAWLFGAMAGPFRNSIDMLDIVMPLIFAIWVSLGVNLYGSMWRLKRRAAIIFVSINSASLASV